VNWFRCVVSRFGCVVSRLGSCRRARMGHHCVIRRQGLRRWRRDLTDTAVRRVVRRAVRRAVRRGGRRGVRGGTRRGGFCGGLRGGGSGSCGCAGVRGHRPDAGQLQNLTRGIRSGGYSDAREHSAGRQCNSKQARGSGHDQLGGDNHRSPAFPRPCIDSSRHSLSAPLVDR
jgi:hypothetical protein